MRIPTAGDRLEFRLPDGAVNPYLLPASVIAAGLEGIDQKLGKRKLCVLSVYDKFTSSNGTL